MIAGYPGSVERSSLADLQNIPAEMRAFDQWVMWRYKARDGRMTKVPYQAWLKKRIRASSTDPDTWAGFGAVTTVFDILHGDRTTGYDGIGFVLSDRDPFTFIDLDHCRDADTGRIEPWAMNILTRFGGYAELSPSRTGIHLFIKASIPGPRNRIGGIEIYSRARFATMTGWPVNLEGAND